MKKFFMFAAMASVALASCTKNEPAVTPEQGDAILFNAPVVAPATKATSTLGTYAFPHSEFFLYAYYDASTDVAYDGEGQLYIDGAEFVHNSTYWGGADKSYYWPKNGDLTFCAYAPKSGQLTLNEATPEDLVLNYTATTEANVDVLYSEWVYDKTNASDTYATANQQGDTGIDLPFYHALSKVQFKVKAGSADAASFIKIKGITLGGVLPTGTLTVTWENEASWNAASGTPLNCTVLAAAADAEHSKAITQEGEALDKYFMFVPQTVSTPNNLVLTYYMATDGDPIQQSTQVSLAGTWEKGTCYTYTIVVNLDEIKIAPVVKTDWATSDADVPAVL